jgi:hypothetical protein
MPQVFPHRQKQKQNNKRQAKTSTVSSLNKGKISVYGVQKGGLDLGFHSHILWFQTGFVSGVNSVFGIGWA